MLLTEEEAKNKRCQESFGPPSDPFPNGVAYSVSVAAFMSPSNCLGSACMAWQWGGPREYEYGKDFEVGHAPADPGWETYETYHVVEGSSVVKFNKWRRLLPGRKGYCGKAGRPQFSR
jgi:hypothetical protein